MWNIFHKKPAVKDFVKSCNGKYPYTTDEYKLDQKPYHWVLEYGELMNGMPMHDVIGGTPVSPGFTDQKFIMWINKESEIPAAIRMKINFPAMRAKVAGELYPMTKREIIDLDIYRQNGVLFNRKFIKVLLPDGSPTHAWVYIGGKKLEEQIKWDIDFYRGRNGSHFCVGKTLDNPKLGTYYYLNATTDLTRDDTCFLHLHKNLSDPPEPKVIEPMPVRVINEPQSKDSRAA